MTMLPIDPAQMPHGMQFDLPTPKPQGGMFGASGPMRGIAGMIGDFLLQRSGMQPVYTPMMQRRQLLKEQEETYQQHRQDSLADYEAKQQIDARYPTQAQPTEYERMLAAAGVTPGSPDYLKHVQAYVSMKENPIVMTPYGPMPYSAVTAPQQVAKPVGKITPIEEGGPSLGGSGMFP